MGRPDFEQFVGESLPALMRHAHALTGDVHAGEDLVQDTLVRMADVWRRIDREGNPLGFARTVMLRLYLRGWHARRRRPTMQPLVETAAAGDAYETVDVRESLRLGLAQLPRLQRAVLVLGYLDDLADEDISVLLGRRPATIRSLRARGLRVLRDRLSADITDLEVSRDTH